MISPARLTVSGFRGFMGEQQLDLLTPVVILFGANHCGKSSTLNALEWCLFGEDCEGEKTNIRERIGWVIPNQHMNPQDVSVELHLDHPDGNLVVRRRLRRHPRKKTPVPELEVTTPGGEVFDGPNAEQHLCRSLRCAFRDFSTTVYQHQETIRGIVTLVPKERNDAIDRLLGLSDYRHLLSGVVGANAKGFQGAIDLAIREFEGRVDTARDVIERGLEQGRRDAEEVGVPRLRLTESTALGIAAQITESLRQLAIEFKQASGLAIVPTRWQDVPVFEQAARAEIKRLRATVPEEKEQSDLYHRQSELSDRITDFGKLKEKDDEIAASTRRLNNAHGSRTGVELRLKGIGDELLNLEKTLKEITGRQKVVLEAVEYLEQSEPDGANECPVCEQVVSNLIPVLKERLQNAFDGRIEDSRKRRTGLRNEREALVAAADEYTRLDKDLKNAIEARRTLNVRAAKLLKRELASEDDPPSILKAEHDRVGRRLEELKGLIDERHQRLSTIDSEMEKLRRVRHVLEQESKFKIIEQIKQSPAFQELSAERDRLATFVNDVEAVQLAISAASTEDARLKLDTAGTTIDSFFRKLANNPAVKRIVLQVKKDARSAGNAYSITDDNEQDLLPVLSQGDLNALALAIFLGLASASGETAPMGFIMLDDPSQSMGTDHKRNLAAVLDEVCQVRQVILATMDQEFRDFLDRALTKTKTWYVFEDWTPKGGPTIRRL